MGALWQDIRYGFRMLLRSPRFAAVGVLILALGIGASTALFSIINTFILSPVPLPGGDRLFEINEIDLAHNQMERVSPLLYEQLKKHPEVFDFRGLFLPEKRGMAGSSWFPFVSVSVWRYNQVIGFGLADSLR
jgi:hypothetical protein